MTIPVWVLLAFAGWTLLILITNVGVYRWGRILTRRSEIGDLQAYNLEGHSDWYKRSMRAHANCVENLPVYGAIVLVIVVAGLDAPTLDVLALVFMGARVIHSLIHLSFKQTNIVTSFRFTFFLVQFVCMVWMSIYVALYAT
ncbi:MAPEG family protein [Persicimonas caeni]|uniref:MAPEG family protein n=1 Tax=Persicimonas caeni TaxID=2292766 RepID=A0A4Y6PN58_PERCE|nr:MAPEG family protein [Persicimonas caeni]QDG49732.1 MAPEG family protein [Persicimonas caeni]QED30953.1 MAPEG family protein [Persicimonas caeni]